MSQQCRRRQFLLPNFLHLFCANLISCVISFLCSQLKAPLAALKLRRVTPPQLLLPSFSPAFYCPLLAFGCCLPWGELCQQFRAQHWKFAAVAKKKDTLSEWGGWEGEDMEKHKEWVGGQARLPDTNSASLWTRAVVVASAERGWQKAGVSAFQCVTLTKFFFPLSPTYAIFPCPLLVPVLPLFLSCDTSVSSLSARLRSSVFVICHCLLSGAFLANK